MRCPVCRVEMIAVEYDGVEVDRCVDCGGIWLDSGELEFLAETAGMETGPLGRTLRSGRKSGTKTERQCPRCDRKMRTGTVMPEGKPVSEGPNGVGADREERCEDRSAAVEIDHCPVECGIWFDAGEIGKVVRCFSGGEAEAVGRYFAAIEGTDLTQEGGS